MTRPPSFQMLSVLRDIHAGRGTHHRCRMWQYQGRSRTIACLRQRGLIDGEDRITEQGRQQIGAPA